MKRNIFFRALPESPESPEGGVKEVLLKNIGVTFRWLQKALLIPLHVIDIPSIFQQITKVNFSKATNDIWHMSDVSLGHTFAQVTCCLLSKVLYSKDQEAIQPSADHISCNTKNYLLRKSLSFLVPTSLPGFLCRGWVDIFLFISFSTFAYRIRNCFSTISTKILVNQYYFRDLWQILECKSLWITHIFAIYSDLPVVSIVMAISAMPYHQFWWFLVQIFVNHPYFRHIQ